MMKPNFLNCVYYLLAKYIVFFFILALLGDRFKKTVINNAETSQEMIMLSLGYILYILFFVSFLILFFCAPIYFIFRVKKGLYFSFLIVLFYSVEFFVYSYFFSPSDMKLGINNAIIGIFFLGLFFHKHIALIFNPSSQNDANRNNLHR